VPQLDEFDYKGTFYCTGNSQSLSRRMNDWRQIVQNGHEIGNHTLFHPCDGQRLDWVKPEYDLNNYSLVRILDELRAASVLLKAVDGKETRTYAYTCGDYIAGETDYRSSMPEFFKAARGEGPLPATMEGYDIFYAPSWMVTDNTAEELISYVEAAREKGTIAIFMFHSVGGGYLNVGAEEHRELLKYLHSRKEEYYVATFMEIMNYIERNSN
jgi:peptidoglycan-N-acetylglucosamine deacetylase